MEMIRLSVNQRKLACNLNEPVYTELYSGYINRSVKVNVLVTEMYDGAERDQICFFAGQKQELKNVQSSQKPCRMNLIFQFYPREPQYQNVILNQHCETKLTGARPTHSA